MGIDLVSVSHRKIHSTRSGLKRQIPTSLVQCYATPQVKLMFKYYQEENVWVTFCCKFAMIYCSFRGSIIQAVCVDNISQSKGISQGTPLSQSPCFTPSDKEVGEEKLLGSQPNPKGMKTTFH